MSQNSPTNASSKTIRLPESAAGVSVEHEEEDDILAANRLAKEGTSTARQTISSRARAVVLVVIGVFFIATLFNVVSNVVLYNKAVDTSVEQATQQRLNGIAQMQARGASKQADGANRALISRGFAPVPIPGVYDAPASDVVIASAAAVVLASLNPVDVANGNTRAIGPAVDTAFDGHVFDISQTGPSRFRVATFVLNYMELQRAGSVPRWVPGSPPPLDATDVPPPRPR